MSTGCEPDKPVNPLPPFRRRHDPVLDGIMSADFVIVSDSTLYA
ncbi:hypothetical protein [Paenibacillus filicis]